MKKIISIVTCMAVLLGAFVIDMPVEAASSQRKTICSWSTVVLQSEDGDFYDEEYDSVEYSYTFSTKKPMVFAVGVKTSVFEDVTRGKLRLILLDEEGYVLQDDAVIKKADSGEYDGWFYNDDFILPKGTYTYVLENDTDQELSIDFAIYGYTSIAKSISMKKNLKSKSGSWLKIGSIKSGLPYVKKVKFGNKKVISAYDIKLNGDIYVWCRKKGTSTIELKLKNGKKYKKKITVSAGYTDMEARVVKYNTRDNYFVVQVKNNSPGNITIYRNNAKAEEDDFKAYDRRIKPSSSVVVKPGKKKNIKFYVDGNPTWYDYNDFTIISTLEYEGLKHTWHVWSTDSVYKFGKKWYATYFDSNF